MSNSSYWTDEARQAQRERIYRTKPWLKSTGAKTVQGKMIVSQNAYKGASYIRIRELTKEVNAMVRANKEAMGRMV